ncbi:MAG TPA: glycosyltransferase family 4 protein [Candidatus Polarisedimenticolia bacterium]|nr:glycosyltransferase family 4 protein [Candidatus Polarisedimenticolia bacterium]
MRFLMLNWRDPKNPISGGAERVTLAHLSALVERGHEVVWYTFDFPGGAREEMYQGIKIVRGGGKGSSIFKAIAWYRRQEKFDLVMDQHHGLPWFAPWWCGTNCVAYIHEVLGPIWTAFYPQPVSTIGPWQERWTHWLYRNVPFWTPSESTKKDLHAHGVRSVTVFPNGSDTPPLPSLEDKPLETPLRLICVSRLAPNKRVDHAVRMVKILAERNVPAHLTIVGGGESKPGVEQLTKALRIEDRVRFAGQLTEEEKNTELRRAHLLVHPSLREGWGLNVIEANAMGTPAAVYPVGGLVDSTVAGETGLVSAAETPESLADALCDIVKKPEVYTRYRVAAWERSKTFSWPVILPQVAAWLEALAAKK